MAQGTPSAVLAGDAKEAAGAQACARPLLRFESVSKRFGDFAAIDQLSLDILHGEFFALLGPSGCGKSTLLRLVAGFEAPDDGRVLLDGEDLAGAPPYLRPVNMMFQSYALFPHMTVAGNIAFGLKQENLTRSAIGARVEEMLALVQLESFARRKPDQLSGGQRQRVALARALAKRPKVLLLDEPLAALDRKLREETQFELKQLQRRLGTTFVIVTHDQEEAMTVADRMAVMAHGRIAQIGTPMDVYEQPNSRYVATFIGDVNLIEARVTRGELQALRIEGPAGTSLVAAAAFGTKADDVVWVALRPEKLHIGAAPPASDGGNAVRGTVLEVGYLGDKSVHKVGIPGGLILKVSEPNATRGGVRRIAPGDTVWLSWAADAGVVLTR